jgi:DNA-binding transcriptional ArsR family regulator
VKDLSGDEPERALKGTALDVYRFLLKKNEPAGAREVQRALGLSSPSVADYHLTKLEELGILKRETNGFSVNKVLLEQSIRVSRFLVPRYFFYAVFAVAVFLIELTLFRPTLIDRQYVFSLAATAVFIAFSSYETAKTWRRGSL